MKNLLKKIEKEKKLFRKVKLNLSRKALLYEKTGTNKALL